jgi:glycosyltransferase involved in cell wall biosynthesis
MSDRPRVLLLAMYRLDAPSSGPLVRIGAVREALSKRVWLDVLSGTRAGRSWAMLRYAISGRLRGLAGVYVESSTSLPGPADLLFLALARALGVRVVTYVRDAYQLFPEYYPLTSLRRRISRAAFLPVFRFLARMSSVVAFPSRGLAQAVLGDGERSRAAMLLPPGARVAAAPPLDASARTFLYVGSLTHEASGGDLLVEAMKRAREQIPDLRLICVLPEGQDASHRNPDWLETVRGGDDEIPGLLPRVLATITPRLRTPYNDLAVPIKVLEYLGYGRPLIVTDATETAAIVEAAGCGVVVPATVEGLAEGIVTVAEAPPATLAEWGDAARRAAEASSWDVRAERILGLLEIES